MARIRIKVKSTGQTGTLDESEFNPSVFERIDEPKQNKILGGYLPLITGGLGGLFGTALGPVGAIGGGTVGAGAGVALENMLEDVLGRQQETKTEQFKSAGKEMALAGAGEALGLGAARALRPVGRLIGSKIPKMGISASVPETPTLSRRALRQSLTGTGKELSEEILDRGVTGSAKSLAKQGIKGYDETIGGLRNLLKNLPPEKAPDYMLNMITDAAEKAKAGFSGAAKRKAVDKAAIDMLEVQLPAVERKGWEAFLDLKQMTDFVAKGKSSKSIGAATTSLNSEVGNAIRSFLKSPGKTSQIAGKEIGEKINKEAIDNYFFKRLQDSGLGGGAKKPYTKGDIIPLIVGGLGGAVTGITTGDPGKALLGGLAGVGLAKAPFSPIVTTNLAKLLNRGVYNPATRAGIKSLPVTTQLMLQSLLKDKY